VCQVHAAVSALVESLRLDNSAADNLFDRVAAKINWAQKRNAQSRKSHTKTARRRLRELGIKLTEIKRCRWRKPAT
jgi:hypothetical protein